MAVIAVVQARVTSSRLPGKVMMEAAGKPMIDHLMERLSYAKLDNLIIAIPDTKTNDMFAEYLYSKAYKVYRGSEDNVLRRFYEATQTLNPCQNDIIVRITADCPLLDPKIVNQVVTKLKLSFYDYMSNTNRYPNGIDVEAMRFWTLKEANKNARSDYDLEHVTPYIIRNNKVGSLEGCKNLRHIRITLDTREDYILIKSIFDKLYHKDRQFTLKQILDVL